MTNYIVKDPASEIRGMARYILKDNWKKLAIGVLIYEVLASFIQVVLSELFTQSVYVEELQTFYEYSPVASLYSVLTAGALTYGLTLFILTFLRFKEIHYDELFEGFSKYFKLLLLSAYIGIKIFLWLMLLIVPGIIAIFRYSMAYYILIDDPEKSVVQCVRESSQMMNGNKAHLLGLYISFIGWYILGVIPYSITNSIMGFPTDTGSVIMLTVINILPLVFVSAYLYTSEALFYELMINQGRENFKYPGEAGLKPGAVIEEKKVNDKDFWE